MKAGRPRYGIVSFDLDGTLADTASEIAEAANRALASHGLARRPVEEITHLIGAGTRELMLRLLERVAHLQPELAARVQAQHVLASFDAHYADTTGSSAVLYPGVAEALPRLRAAGVRLACVTNKEARHAHRVLEALRIAHHFDLVIGGDTLAHRKPDPGVLLHVVKALGGDLLRTAHVGDSRIDVQAARNAGVAAWAVPYGYNAGAPIAESRPERLFADIAEVAEHVLAPPGPAR